MALGSICGLSGFLGLLQIVLDSFALGDVLNDRLELQRTAVVLEEPPDGVLLPDDFAFSTHHAIIERDRRLLLRQRIEIAERNLVILSAQVRQEVGAQEVFAGCSMESAEGGVDKRERPVRREAANKVGLVFDHGAITPLAGGGGLQSAAAFQGRGCEQHIGHRQDANITANQHEAVALRVGEERSSPSEQGIDAKRRDQQCAGGGAALAKAEGSPDQEREGQISERVVLNSIDKPGVKRNERSSD